MAMSSSSAPSTTPDAAEGMVWIRGGTFRMGSDEFYPEERPVREAGVDGFWIDPHAVTVTEFMRFVKATGYATVAERVPDPATYPDTDPALLVAGSLVFIRPPGPVDLDDQSAWWAYLPGADWQHPEGPGSNLDGRARHPVTHVAYADALAYAQWAGRALPTEAEWEFAARGGLDGARYPWGDVEFPNGRAAANTWQGEFPWQNLRIDGYERTSPWGAFAPNGYGLYDMTGNVWEWTCDPYPPSDGDAFARHVVKGGSFLCAPSYNFRYRPAARQGVTIDTSACDVGFRCVVRAGELSSTGR
jgi:formylglycine-generating enzyme required for sulfatase activity